MSALTINLPLLRDAAHAEAGALSWLLQRIEAKDPDHVVALRPHQSADLDIALESGDAQRIVSRTDVGANTPSNVEINASLSLKPSSGAHIQTFLKQYGFALDHIGLNLSHRDINETQWRTLVDSVAAHTPLYRLEIGSANDILLVVRPDERTDDAHVLELVRDASAAQTSLHLCLRINARRADIEAAFPDPFGGYKPGDEPFFRSVALYPELSIPAYLDFSFSDGDMTPWPQIVAAMGKHINP